MVYVCRKNLFILTLTTCILLTINPLASADPQSSGGGNIVSRGINGAVGAISGGISGAVNGAAAGASAGVAAGDNLNNSSTSASASVSASGGADGSSSSSSASASVQGSITIGTTTPKPEGLFGKLKDVVKSVGSVLKDDKKPDNPPFETTTPKPEGIMDKVIDKGSELISQGKNAISNAIDSSKKGSSSQGSISASASASASTSGSGSGEAKAGVSAEIKKEGDKKSEGEKKSEGPIDKLTNMVAKGAQNVQETVNKIEDKVLDVKDKALNAYEEHITKPIQSTSGSGTHNSEGRLTAHASAEANMSSDERQKHLIDEKYKQESELSRPNSVKEVINDAKNRGVLPKNEDQSSIRGNHEDEKSVAVEVFDRAHELSKLPAEKVLKPIDKIFGYEKDPLLRAYDNSHELLRKPLGMLSKPIETVITGAFKTTDESKKDNEKLLATASQQERRDVKLKEAKAKKENRTVVGEIADRTVDLATKPIEIVLKPFDHLFGFDKEGKKNPLLKILDDLYGLSKKPVDSLARPLENILKNMADGQQLYSVSVRMSNEDPEIFTRLTDGALNIADRVLTKPLEIIMKPLDHSLGFDEPGKKNPIVAAAHSLKNATRVGFELFTKPIDRIIKEIAELGSFKNDADLESDFKHRKEEASHLVHILDKLHELVQVPFEIVLRPVSRALGIKKEGKKEPLLRAWDVIHQVVRTPIQVISRPIEEAIGLAREIKPISTPKPEASGNVKADVSSSVGGQAAGVKASVSVTGSKSSDEKGKKNVITEGIKKIEKLAAKPLDVITKPIRKTILGEDNAKVGSDTEKNNREIQSKMKGQAGESNAKQPDKIIKTITKMNNVLLKPLELASQPLSDLLTEGSMGGEKKKLHIKVGVQSQAGNQQQQLQSKSQAQAQVQGQGQGKAQAQSSVQVNKD